jgi:hypothetical protein
MTGGLGVDYLASQSLSEDATEILIDELIQAAQSDDDDWKTFTIKTD